MKITAFQTRDVFLGRWVRLSCGSSESSSPERGRKRLAQDHSLHIRQGTDFIPPGLEHLSFVWKAAKGNTQAGEVANMPERWRLNNPSPTAVSENEIHRTSEKEVSAQSLADTLSYLPTATRSSLLTAPQFCLSSNTSICRGWITNGLSQGSANYWPQPRSGPLPVSVQPVS